MNIDVDGLMAEIGRLHVQVMLLQKQVTDLTKPSEPKPQE